MSVYEVSDYPRQEIFSNTLDVIDAVVEAGGGDFADLSRLLEGVVQPSSFEISEGATEDDDPFESMVERMLSSSRTKKWVSSEKELA